MTVDERMLFIEPPFEDAKVFEHVANHIPFSANPINGLVFSQYAYSAVSVATLKCPLTPVWLGGTLYPYKGSGTRYYEGMMDDQWRWNNMLANEGAAKDATRLHPTLNQAGWYITEEGNIRDWANNDALRQRYEWYYMELMKRLYSIKPLTFLFSPWASGSPTIVAAQAYNKLFMGIKAWLKANHGIEADIRVHLQDAVGMGSLTREQAKGWAHLMIGAAPQIPVKMNVEYFKKSQTGNFIPGDTAEILERERFYQTTPSVKIGACWEIRYWYPFVGYYSNHRE